MKITVVDQSFNWPPKGGASVDLYEVLSRLSKSGYDINLIVPYIIKGGKKLNYWGSGYFQIQKENIPFPVQEIPFTLTQYRPSIYIKKITEIINKIKPDIVFLADGYFFKPYLALALKNYKVLLRFYAYEILCPNNNLQFIFSKNQSGGTAGNSGSSAGNICNKNYLKNQKRCIFCLLQQTFSDFRKDIFRFEFLAAKAFLPSYLKILKKAFSSVAQIVVYNDYIKGILEEYNSNIVINPSGVDTSFFKPSTVPVKNDYKNIIFSGRIEDPAKGVKVLLEAAKRLALDRQDFKIILTSSQKNPQTNLPPYVKLYPWLNREALKNLLCSSQIFVGSLNWREPFGIGVLEAMACGLPVIASAQGGHLITIRDNETGFLIPTNNNVEALTKTLDKLLGNDKLREKMSLAARVRAVEEFDWEVIIDKYYKKGLFAES